MVFRALATTDVLSICFPATLAENAQTDGANSVRKYFRLQEFMDFNATPLILFFLNIALIKQTALAIAALEIRHMHDEIALGSIKTTMNEAYFRIYLCFNSTALCLMPREKAA